MSVRLSKEASVTVWLRKNKAFTNKFVKEWIAEHPKILEESYSSLKRKPAVKDLVANKDIVLKANSSESTDAQKRCREYSRSLLDLGDDPLYNVLLKDILSTSFDLDGLSTKIAKNALLLINGKGTKCSVFLTENGALVPRALNVVASEDMQGKSKRLGESIPRSFLFNQGIVGYVVKNCAAIYMENASKHPRYDPSVDQAISNCSFLCMPIKAPDGHPIGAIQICGRESKNLHFTAGDVEMLEDYLKSTSVAIVNNSQYEETFSRATMLENVMELTKNLIGDTALNLKSFVHKIMTLALQLIPCETCRVFVVDNEPPGACAVIPFKVAFEMESSNEGDISEFTTVGEMSYLELARSVAMTTEIITGDSGQQLYKEDWMTGNNILCVPLLDPNSQAIGVAQLFHKLSAHPFTAADIESFEMFAKICGLGMHNVMAYEKLLKNSAKNEVVIDLLSHHVAVPEEEVNRLWFRRLPSISAINLDSYCFDDLSLNDDDTVMASLKMFHELGLVDCFQINQKVLLRWILTVKMNYKPANYHSWRHAFNVAQTMFTVITTGLMSDHLNPLEQFALMIAAFCHDLDHKGPSNAILAKSENPLALLYSSSTVDHHQIDMCLKILNDKQSNILHSLSVVEYNAVIEVVEHAILSTDLALYLKNKDDFEELIFERTFDWSNLQHTRLLRAMMMPACSISVIAKPWDIQERVIEMLVDELYEHEDREDSEASLPVALMDHHKFSTMQLDIIDDIAVPLYQALASLHGSFQPLLEQVLVTQEEWEQEFKSSEDMLEAVKFEQDKKQRESVESVSTKKTQKKKKLLSKILQAVTAKKRAKKNQKKMAKAKKSCSCEHGRVGSSCRDSGMYLESVPSCSISTPVGIPEREEEHIAKKRRGRKMCLFRPFYFMKKMFRRNKVGESQ